MRHTLIIIAGPEKGRSFSLQDRENLTIGRGGTSDTQINDPHMSRLHCRILVEEDRVLLTDIGSTSGMLVGRKAFDQFELRPGDVIHVGGSKIRYELESSQE